MLAQSEEQRAEANERIKWVLETLVPDTVEVHLKKCSATLERKLGLMPDDLLNNIRVQIWKALLTYAESNRTRLRTYVNKIIENEFKVLLRRASLKKYNSVEYYADVFTSTGIDQDHFFTEETGETIFERRTEFEKIEAMLSDVDRLILAGLSEGQTIAELTKLTQRSRIEIIGAINRIATVVKEYRSQS